ncbi:MAG: tetratricopeptide repeat protein [Bacteroidales bacterium]|jgi:tetratricopeptide (TPR) repeat protein
MKKIAILFIGMIFLMKLEAQVININSAFKYQREGKLDRAKTAIDEACVNEETKNKAKAWFYKGIIYYDIHSSTNPKFKSLDSNALEIAYNSFMTAFKLDEQEKKYTNELNSNLNNCGLEFYNEAVREYNRKKYEKAVNTFSKVIEIKGSTGTTDSVYYYSLMYAGVAAQNTGKPEIKVKSKDFFRKLIDLKYKKTLIYTMLANIYLSEKDTLNALKTLQSGKENLGNNLEFILAEANIYLLKKQIKEAQNMLKLAIEKDPSNYTVLYAIGTNYFNLVKDINYETDSITYKNYYNESEINLKKALELKPDFFDALYNLGALYFNEGVRLFTAGQNIKDQKMYDKAKLVWESKWKDEAQLYLEKAIAISQNDKETLIVLKQIYARTNQTDKLKEVNEKLNKK